ncbi:MAG: hypothetical protein KBF48_05385 [Xanthomonadales bacterium]|nr:hypothetical protein [Xanthomonadales bacterium]
MGRSRSSARRLRDERFDDLHDQLLSGAPLSRNAQGDPVVTYQLRYIHTDALGSPVLETNTAGEEIAGTRTLYEPFGAPLTTPREGAPSYTGHQFDSSTGLSYAQQRYYDPQLGVFYSPDPMTVDTHSAINFNRYAYANNSPYRFVDPDGRTPWNSSQYHEPDTYVRQSTSSESSGSALVERRSEKLVGAGSIEVRNSGSVRLLPQASANGEPAKVGDAVMSKLLNFSDKEKKTVEVTSGERTPEQNRAVGGAARSQHLQNNAADIRIGGYSKTTTADAAHASGEFNRVNEYPDGRGVHVDLKDDGTQGRFDNWQRRDEE